MITKYFLDCARSVGVLALVFAWFFFRQMMKESEGTETMAKKSLLMCVKVRCRT